MISIIICSVNESFLQQLEENVKRTIGVEYEILAWDNRTEKKGICEVYNRMAAKSRFDILCFMHEDIRFETPDWGLLLVSFFRENKEIGVAGIAGSKYKSKKLSGWYTGDPALDCENIIHAYPDGRSEHLLLQPGKPMEFEKVVCVDGVFMAVRRGVWNEVRFDQENLTGFHFYDIDFSVRASKQTGLAVLYTLLITHITHGGDFGDKWVTVAFDYHQRNASGLPVSCSQVSGSVEKKIVITWLNLLKHQKISFRNKCKWILRQNLMSRPAYWYPVFKFFLYKPLGLKNLHKRVGKK